MSEAIPQRRRVVRARIAVSSVFLLHGATYGSFATRIPWLKERLDVSPGALGLALLMVSLGAVTAMPFAGRLVHTHGGRTITAWTIVGFALVLALPALSPSLLVLAVTLAITGALSGTADMAMNAQGVVIEQRYGRSIMSGLHGLWSVGGLLGSGVGALAAHFGVDARVHLGFMAIVLAGLGWLASRGLLDTRPDATEPAPPHFALPTRGVLVIGLLGFCAVFAEGSSSDWCAVYLTQIANAGPGVAATAYSGFAFTMAAGRLSGDYLVRRFGPVRTVRITALVGVAGGVLVVIARTAWLGILGFGLVGIGVAVVVPLAFAAAGRTDAQPARAIAGVATISYGAGLAAPAIVGGLANLTSLSFSFAVVTALIGCVAVWAGALGRAEEGPCEASRPRSRSGPSRVPGRI